MPDPNFILLYVDSPAASAGFYADLLGKPPVESSATFAMFALESGVMLGLWSRRTVAPAATASPGAGELAFALRRQRRRRPDVRRLARARTADRAGADRPRFRTHVRGARSGRASAAGVCAGGGMRAAS